jgi:DMSO/TMAO reductase YedYZ molybdopterin-dependent catalytic subunit
MTILTRRALIQAGILGAVGTGTFRNTFAADPALIVRNTRPLDLETPVEVFDKYLTPNRLFFVRSHFGAPAIGLSAWQLEVSGSVTKPLSLSLQDLNEFEQVTIAAVLQCSGNGRAFFKPVIPGIGWERGAVGNAEWSGIRLKDLLARAGIGKDAAHVHLQGADGPPSPKTPAFLRSIPIGRALDPNTLLATRMNGEPLPRQHGGPIRLVVPGWSGNHWVKWLRWITVASNEAPGFYMQTGYRMPKVPVPPGVNPKPSDLEPVTYLNVKSLIAWPARSRDIQSGAVEVLGVAWTGLGLVTKVEIAVDNGAWQSAALVGPEREGSWRQWRFAWTSQRGRHTIRARATDSSGAKQPPATPWNKSGYLWNGIDEVTVGVKERA